MTCRLADMHRKEVINIKDGTKYGCVNDLEIDPVSAKLVSVVIYGRLRFFGLFGREEDIRIRWEDIQMIGDDTILVNCQLVTQKRKKGFLAGFFSNV